MVLSGEIYLGNNVEAWITALVTALVVYVLLSVTRRVIIGRLSKLAEKTENQVDDIIVAALMRTKLFFTAIVAVYVGSNMLTLSPVATRIVQSATVLGTLVQVGLWGNGAIAFWLKNTLKKRAEEDAASATTLAGVTFVIRLAFWSVLLLLALDNLGIDITALVAGLGIGGIAVALALQNILGDLFASLSIALDKPFIIGDFIIVDEHVGTVEYIGLKTTRIRSLAGEQIVFSNTDLLGSRIRNFKRMQERRVVFSVGVTYETPHRMLSEISTMLKEIVSAQPGTRFDRAHFKEFADSALIYEIVYYLSTPDFTTYMDTQQSINLAIHKRFEEKGIEFAYPTRTIHLLGSSEAADD